MRFIRFIIIVTRVPLKLGRYYINKQIWLIKPKTFFVILKFSFFKEPPKMSFIGQ